jgi:hypothetical protein
MQDDLEQRTFAVRFIARLVEPDGSIIENQAARELQEAFAERRRERAATGQRALEDLNYFPESWVDGRELVRKLTGTIDGRHCQFYAFKGRSFQPSLAVIYAKDESAAQRCMRLLESGLSTWDLFAAYVQSYFLWPAWMNLRQQARAVAAELRGDLPTLPADADDAQQVERKSLYEAGGLTWQDWGSSIVHLPSLEGVEPDYEALFAMAERMPVTLLNLYLVRAFDSVRFFDRWDGVEFSTIQQLMQFGLVVARQPPTPQEAFHLMGRAELRQLVQEAGTGFKARSSSELREHLMGRMTPALEARAVERCRYKRYQILPPAGWTWEQFQFFRHDYPAMLDALNQWLFNGWAPARAAERFATLA